MATPAPADALATAGDIVLAGASCHYVHLAPAPARPTVGQLLAAARRAAAALDPAPSPEGRWRRIDPAAPRPRPRVRAVSLPPGGFAALPSRRHGQAVVHLASGEAHAVSVSPQGGLRAVRRLVADRSWAWGGRHRYHLVNTGPATAVVVCCD